MIADAQLLTQLLALSTDSLVHNVGLATVVLSGLAVLGLATSEIRRVAESHQAPKKLLG